CMQSTQLWTF
nr:immunoglobulin light chain junction region [Macaca mulatta]MOW08268.1 immunoglobulin light chain junction region [Macaca mulatta]MOW10022.1 immunoglobulin light chain junction region [Macaca mulatta]MOW10325.1 immunoglobulin light chain junction region [Macaca mulatta]MOW11995.1 immunoglobulin light chain junction region [Macaca mulatta]